MRQAVGTRERLSLEEWSRGLGPSEKPREAAEASLKDRPEGCPREVSTQK